MHLDFLIVAALKDEAKEIEKLLIEPIHESDMVVGNVTRWKEMGSYQVGLIDLFGMGTNNAQQVTQDAIGSHRPRAVLMTGIAAGLADGEFEVQLGDLMVPYGVIPYELAKVRGEKSGFMRLFTPKVEHRGIAWAVADSLWRCAAHTAGIPQQPWLQKVSAARPGQPTKAPSIHASVEGVIGSGEKVVAAEEAEVRRWLLNHYRRQALGLEMESYGALVACRTFDTPFLMAKASVDRATAEKDDGWRTYACQLSAAFLLTVLERYEKPATRLIHRHREESKDAAAGLREHLPALDFGCGIRTATSFEQLRQKIYHDGDGDIHRLLPTGVVPTIALYGGGGAGKSTIARRLFIRAQDRGPVLLIDLMIDNTLAGAVAGLGALLNSREST